MQIDDLITRLKAEVPEFQGRVEGAAELAALVKDGRAPNRTPSAYVLPLGLVATPATTATGVHRQLFTETFGVVIVLTVANDATGAKGLPKINLLRDAVIQKLAGWQPTGAFEAISLRRAVLKSMVKGTITLQVDFNTDDYLRI